MGIRLWVKEKVAKLRGKHEDDDAHDDAKHRQLQTVDGGHATRPTRGCSVLFERARKHHADRNGRKKTRSRSHPSRVSHTRSEDSSSQSKPCSVCETAFQVTTSKYLDYCSPECKAKAFEEKGRASEAPPRLSEWI